MLVDFVPKHQYKLKVKTVKSAIILHLLSKNDSFSSLKKLTNVFKLPSQKPPISSRNTAKLQRKKKMAVYWLF